MKINKRAIIPVMLTLAAMLAGFSSIVLSAHGEFVMAARMIILSMILDGLDGAMARLLKGTSSFGAELDTFVDMTSFGLAPALLAYESCWHQFGGWGMVLAAGMVLSGASRLSRFRIIDPFRGQQGFLGLPITCAGGFVTCMVFADQSGALKAWGWDWFSLVNGPLAIGIWIAAAIMLVLQVSHVHYTKASKHPVVFLSGIVLVVMMFINFAHLSGVAALGGCAVGVYFAFFSPFIHPPAAKPEEKPAAAS